MSSNIPIAQMGELRPRATEKMFERDKQFVCQEVGRVPACLALFYFITCACSYADLVRVCIVSLYPFPPLPLPASHERRQPLGQGIAVSGSSKN